jgi:hypothetical protein
LRWRIHVADFVVGAKEADLAEIGEPLREIEIVPREEPLPQELPVHEPQAPERELEPV